MRKIHFSIFRCLCSVTTITSYLTCFNWASLHRSFMIQTGIRKRYDVLSQFASKLSFKSLTGSLSSYQRICKRRRDAIELARLRMLRFIDFLQARRTRCSEFNRLKNSDCELTSDVTFVCATLIFTGCFACLQ